MRAGSWSIALKKLHLMLEVVSSVSYCQLKFFCCCCSLENEYENDITKDRGGSFSKHTGLISKVKDFNF